MTSTATDSARTAIEHSYGEEAAELASQTGNAVADTGKTSGNILLVRRLSRLVLLWAPLPVSLHVALIPFVWIFRGLPRLSRGDISHRAPRMS